MNIAIILAGGKGTRMGIEGSKQFIEIAGKPILAHTMKRFESFSCIDKIAVVYPLGYLDELKQIVEKENITKFIASAESGFPRFFSYIRGMESVADLLGPKDILVFHNGVNPVIREETVKTCISLAKEKDFVVSQEISTSKTFINSKENYSKAVVYIPTDRVCRSQTPIAVNGLKVLQLLEDHFPEIIDEETSLEEIVAKHADLYFTDPDPLAVKLTYPEQIPIIEALIKAFPPEKKEDVK